MIILKENVNLRHYWDGKANYNRFANSTNMTTSASLVLWMNERGYDLINVDDAIKELSKMRNIGKLVLGSFRNLVKTLVEEEIITDDAEQAIQNPYGIEWERRTFELAKEGKVWDAESKAIVDLKPKWIPKPFDRVVTRVDDDAIWTANIFSHVDQYGEYVTIGFVGVYPYCLPYNEETAKLIGTTDDWK